MVTGNNTMKKIHYVRGFVLSQRFSTGVQQEFLKLAIPDLVRGTDLLSLRLSNKKMTTTKWCESKLILFFLPDHQKSILLGVPKNFINLCAMR